ncbi:phosphoglycerate mutase-like protein 1 [Mangifera indica]|uniref:phosphoglycerate mutase-like protein 1 n=1 Tax=Mangifera indica TaxID=29780 RepID=UPI001CFA0251|nr:phosphoglycerate mutase-like protein 1 [Mangifera indica]
MVTATAQFLFSQHYCKILHLVRHGQAMHNVEAEKSLEALLSPKLFDAELSDLGREQVAKLRKRVLTSGLLKKIDLVVISPQLRAMQTAVGVFGCEDHMNVYGLDKCKPPVTVANDLNAKPALNCCSCPALLAFEKCRDRMGLRPSDKRRSVSEYQSIFPSMDFSLMESDEDELWNPDIRESYKEIFYRMVEFVEWLWTRPEKEIVIVSHGVILQFLLYALENDAPPQSNETLLSTKRMMDSETDSSAPPTLCG